MKGDKYSRRPASNAALHSKGIRIRSMDRAGEIIIGWDPRNRMRRHSFSICEWNPLMTVTPSSRNVLAVSYVGKMASPGVRAEQKRAILSEDSKPSGPSSCKEAGDCGVSRVAKYGGHSAAVGVSVLGWSAFISN